MGITDTALTFGWNGTRHAYDYDVRELVPPELDADGCFELHRLRRFMSQIKGEDRRGPQATGYTASLMWRKLQDGVRFKGVPMQFVCTHCGGDLLAICPYTRETHSKIAVKLDALSYRQYLPGFLRARVDRVGRELVMHFSALDYALEHGRQE